MDSGEEIFNDLGFIRAKIENIIELLGRVESSSKEADIERKEETLRLANELKEETLKIALELKTKTEDLQDKIELLRSREIYALQVRLDKIEDRHEVSDKLTEKRKKRLLTALKWLGGAITIAIPVLLKRMIDKYGWLSASLPR